MLKYPESIMVPLKHVNVLEWDHGTQLLGLVPPATLQNVKLRYLDSAGCVRVCGGVWVAYTY